MAGTNFIVDEAFIEIQWGPEKLSSFLFKWFKLQTYSIIDWFIIQVMA